MRDEIIATVLFCFTTCIVGCGKSDSMNTAPLTDEQKQQIKANDEKVNEEENALNTKRKKR